MSQDDQLPRHVAIMMDGNGRWARMRNLPRPKGHEAGAAAAREIVEECARQGLQQVTLYAISAENVRLRPAREVQAIMGLLKKYLQAELSTIMENNIRFKAIGRTEAFPGDVQDEIRKVVEASSGNSGLTLCLAVNYGGRAEIADAAKKLAADVKAGELEPEEVDEETFGRYLYTAGMPDPDLVIRTGGEMRMSNFLLWQAHYAELWVTPVLWPDFRKEHLREAFREYGNRVRKFGGLEAG